MLPNQPVKWASQKYHLLEHHDEASESCIFPTEYLGGANRPFLLKWISECGWWLMYSRKLDGALCIFCALFAPAKDRKNMVNALFKKWHHKSKVITPHVNKPSHTVASQVAEDYLQSIELPGKTIRVIMDGIKAENIAENGHILTCVAETIPYCGCTVRCTQGRSLILLEILETCWPWWDCYPVMAPWPHNPMTPCSSSTWVFSRCEMSPTCHLSFRMKWLKWLVTRWYSARLLEKSKMHDSIRSWSTKLHHTTLLLTPVCIRFVDLSPIDTVTLHGLLMLGNCFLDFAVEHWFGCHATEPGFAGDIGAIKVWLIDWLIDWDKDLDIVEKLMGVVSLPRITGLNIANKLKSVPSHLGLDITDCRGLGYHGAENMSSGRVGVQALIREEAPKAVHTHCSGHCLNNVIASSCGLPVVRMLDKMKSAGNFFIKSPTIERFLKEVTV